eukprot:scaffold185962_cov32-Tisochrysis_lutea.AAC.2
MEDDQLRLRASASGASSRGIVRPPASAGKYIDLDKIAVLRDVLSSTEKVGVRARASVLTVAARRSNVSPIRLLPGTSFEPHVP